MNGFLTVRNFILHPITGTGGQRAEGDIIALRFPGGREFDDSDVDDHVFSDVDQQQLIIAEVVDRQPCKLNASWRKEENVADVLWRFAPAESLERIAREWARTGGICEGGFYYNSLCIGASRNEDLQREFPNSRQLTWDEVLRFFDQRVLKTRKSQARQKTVGPRRQRNLRHLGRCSSPIRPFLGRTV
jgi:hypothetical protein